MRRQQLGILALGTALVVAVAGCGGNGTVNPTGNVGNFQAINQGNPNQARGITVVPSANQITSLVSNATNLNAIVTTAGSTITTTGALSLCGNNNFVLSNLISIGGSPQSEVFAVNNGSVTPIQVNADGTLALGTVTGNNIVPFTGGNASCSDGQTCFVAAQVSLQVNGRGNPPSGTFDVLDSFTENGNNAPTQSFISLPVPAPLISLTSNVALQDGAPVFPDVYGADGTNTQMFDSTTGLIGTPFSIDGAGTDSVVTDTGFSSQGNNTPGTVVVAAGPQTVAQTAGGTVFGINVGSAFVVPNQNDAAFVPAGSTFLPLAGATATTVPTSATFVFGNTVNGSSVLEPAFVVIGTNTPTVPLVIIPVNQQVNQQNGFLNLALANQLPTQFDGQGVIGLNSPQASGPLSLGFNELNAFAGVTASGVGTPENAFGAAINPLSNPALLFGNLNGNFNVALGNEAASQNGNPVVFFSAVSP